MSKTHAALMVDIEGLSLQAEDREILQHPLVGGLILFGRNYEDPEQLSALVKTIRICKPSILIAVDQEGGRVQRFQQGFQRLPPIGDLGLEYCEDQTAALHKAEILGWLMAIELRSHDVDLSFAPVLDLRAGNDEIIGDRAFHSDPEIVSELAQAWIAGMQAAGMQAVGKHFPGHGHVQGDSHLMLPNDLRPLTEIYKKDVMPYRVLGEALSAVMMAHVCYTDECGLPASFSPYWIRQVLRQELGFQGTVFTDDLTMEGAKIIGDIQARAEAALEAGCDMLPVCNNREQVESLLDTLKIRRDDQAQARIEALLGRFPINQERVLQDPRWQEIRQFDRS